VYSVLGIVSRYRFYCYVGTLALLWSGSLRKRAGLFRAPVGCRFTSGMGAASDRMAGRLAEMDFSGRLPMGVHSGDPVDPVLNLAVPPSF